LAQSAEGAEDDAADAIAQVSAANIAENDVVIGVAASGRTPFTVAAVKEARKRGALTLGVANNTDTPLLAEVEHPLLADTGSEIIAGSTRMKAGTAQKAILNIVSTATMLRCGLVYRGLMVNLRVSNDKLAARARGMVQRLAGVDEAAAGAALATSQDHIKKAVLLAAGAALERVDDLLAANAQNLRAALEQNAHEQNAHEQNAHEQNAHEQNAREPS
jgi:N-acetylmuramic acid 6-phosphate etherase